MNFRPEQSEILALPFEGHYFLRGPAGSGKTTSAVLRLARMLREYQDQHTLLLTPQRSMVSTYTRILTSEGVIPHQNLSMTTMGSLVRRMIHLFWPVFSSKAGFKHPYRPPKFLTLETAQYYMSQVVQPMLDQGSFSSITIKRHRLYSQLIDDLNKSAVVGFPHTEVGERLSSAWAGEEARINVYTDVQNAISAFRKFCLANNLLDFSLQVEVFTQFFWTDPNCQGYLRGMFDHLFYDNCEEDPPYVHEILIDWLSSFTSSLILFDEDAGYRRFLGADPISAMRLQEMSCQTIKLEQNYVSSPQVKLIQNALLSDNLSKNPIKGVNQAAVEDVIKLPVASLRFFPQMIADTATNICDLIAFGIAPNQIAVLAPFLSDSLAFSLKSELAKKGIPVRVLRPSIPLKNDPYIQCLLTLSQLAYPTWDYPPDQYQLANCLVNAIEGLDIVRAHLLIEHAFPESYSGQSPRQFKDFSPDIQKRITAQSCERFHTLMDWIAFRKKDEPYDVFISRLFGEVLSQPGFGFHFPLDAGGSAAMLIESYQKFRLSSSSEESSDLDNLANAYVHAVQEGLISAQYLAALDQDNQNEVLIAPALTYLVQNIIVDYQFWLNIGSAGWYQRLEQPLTHPYVLSRNWVAGQKWTDEQETRLNKENLDIVVRGLLNRCRKGVYLEFSDYNETGTEERGLLMSRLHALFSTAYQAGKYD